MKCAVLYHTVLYSRHLRRSLSTTVHSGLPSEYMQSVHVDTQSLCVPGTQADAASLLPVYFEAVTASSNSIICMTYVLVSAASCIIVRCWCSEGMRLGLEEGRQLGLQKGFEIGR